MRARLQDQWRYPTPPSPKNPLARLLGVGYVPHMSKVTEMLRARRQEVLAEMAPLKAELREIDAALAAIEDKPAPQTAKPKSGETVADHVNILLQEHPEGLHTRDFVEAMAKRFKRQITNRNMSWHLSKLKRERQLTQDGGGAWKLPQQKDETPSDGSDGVSKVAGEVGSSPDHEGESVTGNSPSNSS